MQEDERTRLRLRHLASFRKDLGKAGDACEQVGRLRSNSTTPMLALEDIISMKTLQVADKSFMLLFPVALAVTLVLSPWSASAQTPKRVGLQMPVDPMTGIPYTQQQLQSGTYDRRTGILTLSPPVSDFRVVNGQVYNIRKSTLWKERTFEYVKREDSLVIAKEVTFKPIYEQRWFEGTTVTERQRIGAGSSGFYQAPGYKKVRVDNQRIVGQRVTITNLTCTDLAVEKDFKIPTMIVETSETNRMVLHDIGTIYVPGKTNSVVVTKP